MSDPVSQLPLPLGFAVSVADVDRWRAEAMELESQIVELAARRDRLKQMIGAAVALFSLMDVPPVQSRAAAGGADRPSGTPPDAETPAPVFGAALVDAAPVVEAGVEAPAAGPVPTDTAITDEDDDEGDTPDDRQAGKPGMTRAVRDGVYAAEAGVAPFELKASLLRPESGVAERLGTSDKGFYNAIDRLARRDVIIRRHGRLFSPEALSRFEEAVAAGQLFGEVPKHPSHSPMGDAILQIVTANPGIFGGHIIVKLKENPEFAAALNPHSTGAYNIIARLVKRGQLKKLGKGYYVEKEV